MSNESITFLIAIWGAVLGTIGTIISLILLIREIRKDQRNLKISVALTKENPFWLIADSRDIVTEKSLPKYIVVTIYNNGFRPIQIKQIILEMLTGVIIRNCRFKENIQFPISLNENQTIEAFFGVEDIIPIIKSGKDRLNKVNISDMNGIQWNVNIPKPTTIKILKNN